MNTPSINGHSGRDLVVKVLVAVLVSAVVTFSIAFYAITNYWAGAESATGALAEPQPLYWVAPMDANYRRDGPGKSPMGMDLIPVYERDSGQRDSPGTVRISPEVINNLGVRTASVQRRVIDTQIITVGYVQYDQDQLLHVHPRVEGWIEKLHIKSGGEPVVKGQPLYELYSPQLVIAQEELMLALNQNSARLVAGAEDRLRALKIDEAVIREIKRSRQVAQALPFYAPQTGIVDNLNVREGFFVKPGTTLMSVGTLTEVWVEAEVYERQAAMVVVGLPVTMTLDYLPGKVWRGTVDYVYPALDPETRTARVRLRFDNSDGLLKPNMFAQVAIHTNPSDAVLAIPREAVIRTGQQDRVVLSLDQGRFKSVAVLLGRMTPTHAEIIRGLEEGESVVTSAQFLIDSESSKTSDFQRLNVRDIEPQALMNDSNSATVSGVINQIDVGQRLINVSREAIAKWHRPAATMDFAVDEMLDITGFQPGDPVRFSFWISNGEFLITSIESLAEPAPVSTESETQAEGEVHNHD